MRELLDGAVLGSHRPVDSAMIDRMFLVFGWRPGKNENVVALAGLHFGKGAAADLLHRNQVHRHLGVVLFAPFRGHFVHKPFVKFREKVRPFCVPQGVETGECAGSEYGERSCDRRSGNQFDQIPARNPPSFWMGHPRDLEDTFPPARRRPCQGAELRKVSKSSIANWRPLSQTLASFAPPSAHSEISRRTAGSGNSRSEPGSAATRWR